MTELNDMDLFQAHDETDNLAALVAIKQATGVTLRIKTHDRITKVVRKSDTELVVQLITYEEVERKYDTYLVNQGIKLVPISRATGTWKVGQAFVVWGDKSTFSRIRVAAFETTSIADFWAKRDHENMCYRPGTPNSPMESASVTAEGYSPARMVRHWDMV